MAEPSPVLALFGQRIKRERVERGWSTRDLCARAGVPGPSSVSRVEHGREVGLSTAIKLAAALGVSFDALIAEQVCATCDGNPPAGFICGNCGRERDRAVVMRLREEAR